MRGVHTKGSIKYLIKQVFKGPQKLCQAFERVQSDKSLITFIRT